MWKFNVAETINKILGVLILALVTRILTPSAFGTYLYYQTIYAKLLMLAIYSTDYHLLINYKIDRKFITTPTFYRVLGIRFILLLVAIIVGIFLFTPSEDVAFWPYFIALFIASQFVFDSLLYVENIKRSFIVLRFLSQVFTLLFLLVFWLGWLSPYYISFIQTIQVSTLTLGGFFVAKKYLPANLLRNVIKHFKAIDFSILKHLSSYFAIRNFFGFVTTIEIILFNFYDFEPYRNLFAEGMRLAGILTPFAIFYIRFNLDNLKGKFYTYIIMSCAALVILSPFYTILLFGVQYADNIYYYNIFILVFLFNAFIESDFSNILIEKEKNSRKLGALNSLFFISTSALMLLFLQFDLNVEAFLMLFVLKMVLYYLALSLLITKQLRPLYRVLTGICVVLILNQLLNISGYFETATRISTTLTQMVSKLVPN